MTGSDQLSLSFEPGLTSRYREIEDAINACVISSRLGTDGIAPALNMAPSELSKRLHAHMAAKEGDPSNRPLRVSDMVRIIEVTGDYRPIYWLAEKFLRDPEAQRTAAIQQLGMLAPMLLALAEQAGIPTKPARR